MDRNLANKLIVALAAAMAASCATRTTQAVDYVDPLIGSGAHGHVFVGANVPFGMVQLGSTSIPQEWDFTSGYHRRDSTVIGFSHTHLSGTGIGDLFDITVMPVTGKVTYARGSEDDPASGLWSYADRTREVTRPGYYSVPLMRYGITAELTATERTGYHRYTFPQSDSAAIVIDLQNGGCWDRPTDTYLTLEGDTAISGYRYSTGWAQDQRVYFYGVLSRPVESLSMHGTDERFGRLALGHTDEGDTVTLRLAISPTSVDAARHALTAETGDLSFGQVAQQAHDKWAEQLSRIRVEGSPDSVKTIFYTALYHALFAPTIFHDIDSTPAYSFLSLWDTYRAEMPLLAIIRPDVHADIISSMVTASERRGHLPVWDLWGNETYCMIGKPGVISAAEHLMHLLESPERSADHDSIVNRLYAAIVRSADDTARGAGLRDKYGYIPIDLKKEAVANDMEYAIADAAAAMAAAAMGDSARAHQWAARSRSYRNYFDPTTGFIRGLDSHGNRRAPFNPFSADHRNDDYCEGNAWQYTWLAPHDPRGLSQLFGGDSLMVAALDRLFEAPSNIDGDDVSPDITGLIGQYAHGNEPSHHTAYLYATAGRPDKTARRVSEILRTQYSARPEGLSGNEDAGQMSAWYVLSALGFYPIFPPDGLFWIGSPMFSRAEMDVPGGVFTIVCDNFSPDHPVVASATLNGQPLGRPYITYREIIDGGELRLQMTN